MEPSEFLLLSTIRIETTVPNGICTGTGFFFSLKNDEATKMHVPVIVTNKHVIKNAITGKLRFSLKDSEGNPLWGEYFDLTLNNFESRWILHPDKSVDLCILPIANIHREIQKSHKELNYTVLRPCDIPTFAIDLSKLTIEAFIISTLGSGCSSVPEHNGHFPGLKFSCSKSPIDSRRIFWC